MSQVSSKILPSNLQKQSPKKKASVSNEVKLDVIQPIPFELNGDSFYFFEGNERYIPFLDQKDNFFNILLEARLLSVTQNSCVSNRADYCTGSGITLANLPAGQKLKKYNEQLYSFLTGINVQSESMKDIIHQINDHLDTFGNCFIEIVKGVAGSEKYVYVYVWNTPECRLAAIQKGKKFPEAALKSKRFLKQLTLSSIDGVTRVPLLNKRKINDTQYWKNEGNTTRTVIFLRTKMSGYPHYGLPIGISSLPQQVGEYKGIRYNLDNFDNNLSPGGFIGMKGNYTKAEASAQSKDINKQLVGPGKSGRWIAVGHEQGLDGIDIKTFDTKREGSFIEFDANCEKKITLANQWNKVLNGLDDGNALGKGSGYVKSVYDIAMKKVIIPRQEYLFENFIEPLLQICDDYMGTKWADEEFIFLNQTPVSFLTLVKNIDPAITRNEIRKELSLTEDPSPAGKEYMGAKAPMNLGKPTEEEPKEEEVPNESGE
jgi:hypothetical protein